MATQLLRLEKRDDSPNGRLYGWRTLLVFMSDGQVLLGSGQGRYKLLRPRTEALRAACASPEALRTWAEGRGFSEAPKRGGSR